MTLIKQAEAMDLIKDLSPNEYQSLRVMLVTNPTIEDFKALMKT